MHYNIVMELVAGSLFAILVLCVIRTLQVWLALRVLLESPNIVQIHRVKKPRNRRSPWRSPA